jgi:hypothetical protein
MCPEERKPLELKEDLDQAKARRNAARQNRGCANTAGGAVQYGRKAGASSSPVSVIAWLDRAIQQPPDNSNLGQF